MTQLYFWGGLSIAVIIYSAIVYFHTRQNEMEKIINNQAKDLADEKIKNAVNSEPIDEVLDYVKRRKPPGES